MPKMIPSHLDPDTKSTAEKKLFSVFQSMPETDDWVVLHSVSIAEHPTQKEGEADFVVIIPEGGILVLEVKGGGISCESDTWYSVDRYGNRHPIHDPEDESREAAHAFVNYIAKHPKNTTGLQRILVGNAVLFPDVDFSGITLPGLAPQQVGDRRCVRDMKSYLLELMDFWNQRTPKGILHPTLSQVHELVDMLTPDFECSVSLSTHIHNLNNEILLLTEQQQDVFLGISENERCFVYGGAGTGKTAIARAMGEQKAAEGIETAIFCSTRTLGEHLNALCSGREHLTCGSLPFYMRSVVAKHDGNESYEQAAKAGKLKEYYQSTLPELFLELAKDGKLPRYDFLILDEGQDLMTEGYLKVLNALLKGGLAEGSWYFFLDPENQQLYPKASALAQIQSLLRTFTEDYVPFRLRSNCRNSEAVIQKIDQLFQTTTNHTHREDEGPEVKIQTYQNQDECVRLLVQILKDLKKGEVREEDIVILSPKNFPNSSASRLYRFDVQQDYSKRSGKLFFSTIDHFKGLDSPVVILTDLDSLSTEKQRADLYNGMTRSTGLLYMLLSEKAEQNLKVMQN